MSGYSVSECEEKICAYLKSTQSEQIYLNTENKDNIIKLQSLTLDTTVEPNRPKIENFQVIDESDQLFLPLILFEEFATNVQKPEQVVETTKDGSKPQNKVTSQTQKEESIKFNDL